jgi:hypothetical protein
MSKVDPVARSHVALGKSVQSYRDGDGQLSITAGLRALAWAVLYVGDQLKRQADFWQEGGR